jgi:hypothetical protein
MDVAVLNDFVGRQEVARVVVRAVEAEHINLSRFITPDHHSVTSPTTGVETRKDHVTDAPRPFALHAKERVFDIENQVVSLIVY